MTNLTVLEKPVYLELIPTDNVYLDGGYNKSVRFTVHPYSNENLLQVSNKYGIKFPFEKLVTAYDGTCKCSTCGAVYSGYQPRCTQIVRKVRYRENEYRTGLVPSEKGVVGGIIQIKDKYSNYIKNYKVEHIVHETCAGLTTWTLSKEFDAQSQYFRMLEVIQDLENAPSPFDQFKDSFLPGVKEHLETKYLLKNVQELIMTTISHRGALEQVASKMNSAGQSLIF